MWGKPKRNNWDKIVAKALTGLLPENVLSSNDLFEKYTAQLRENGKQIEDVYFEVGSGQTQPVAVAMNIAALAGKHFGSEIKLSTINVNSDNVGLVSFGKCCNPIPNDNIRALFTRNNGLIIHRENCQNLLKSDAEQQLDADWDALCSLKMVRCQNPHCLARHAWFAGGDEQCHFPRGWQYCGGGNAVQIAKHHGNGGFH